MELYSKPREEYSRIINKNTKYKEFAVMSIPVECNGSSYIKVVYYDTKLKKTSKPKGISFLTQDGIPVIEKEIKRQLMLCFIRLDHMLGQGSSGRFKNAYLSEGQLQKEEKDYQNMTEALKVLKDKGAEGTEQAAQVLKNLTAVKREISEAIGIYMECMSSCTAQKDKVTAENINSLYEAYVRVMTANFKKMKLINTAASYYSGIRKAAIKKRRSLEFIFSYGSMRKGLIDIDYQLSYFNRLLPIYNDVIHMSFDRYKAYIGDMESQELSSSMKMLRQMES